MQPKSPLRLRGSADTLQPHPRPYLLRPALPPPPVNSPGLFPPHSPALAVPSAWWLDSCLLPSFCRDVLPSEKPSPIPIDPFPFTRLYLSPKHLSVPHTVGFFSVFVPSSSVFLTGVCSVVTAACHPRPLPRMHRAQGKFPGNACGRSGWTEKPLSHFHQVR